ncbi:hypothetical protein [Hymenobacter psychrotolerans]|uniref:SpoIIAA-like n=1 Tax=Hymenobacter psychrotolerans DSM 18569 TaxID=1121959 RepID=A0A1M7AXK8_9BACT|nr:hypothetical protein [Hymenobacter psychrotolerans]SHL47346.1 hypothetical protein SAMN02746009_02794 [Hymenobacter psychrotolerans DSM 18569]
MSVPASILSPEPEPGYTPPPRAEHLGLLRDEHGAPLLRLLYYTAESLLYAQWFGNLTAESVVAGARAALVAQQQLQPALLLNDKSVATGDWTESMDWLEVEWLPLTLRHGLRAFAYVFAPDMLNQPSALDFAARVSRQLSIQLFYDLDTALTWLRRQA